MHDPLIHEKGWGVTWGISYEMGAIGFHVNNKSALTIGDGTTFYIYYMLPFN